KGKQYLLEDGSRGFSNLRTRLQSPSVILLAAVGVLLLIACTNIAGLLSARGMQRRHEMAVRLSLGATVGRVVRQLLVENIVLAALGGCCGLLIARWVITMLASLIGNGNPTSTLDVSIDGPVLATTAAVCLLASLLFGLLPAWQASRPDPVSGLRNGGFFGGAKKFIPARRLLVVVQVALSVVLLSGAGVLAQSLRKLETVDLDPYAFNRKQKYFNKRQVKRPQVVG
ncbi:MAG: FtsX-like permease family protein, partial [Acidobacteria bacterium]|nr:FtsX-like permease family protein [Acidobacteriota bacterium]